MQYTVISSNSLTEVIQVVDESLLASWKLYGNLVVSAEYVYNHGVKESEPWYYQSMTKE